MIARSIITLLAAVTLASCGTSSKSDPDASAIPLGPAEIRGALVANTLYREGGDWWQSWEYAGFHRDDGTMIGRAWWPGGAETAVGTWEISQDGLYCRTWNNHWGDGAYGCFRVERSGDTLIFAQTENAPGNTETYRYQHKPGNPFGLATD